ncbi:MAG: acetyltransferase-like isoleucine patch superfamily enzyme [Parvicella sp.]|jgi:acetyltransferase-like isoleucine patch superfamily enzyme
MLVRLFEKIIQKRNSEFSFHKSVTFLDIYSIVFGKAMSVLRSLKLLFRFKYLHLIFLGKGVSFIGLRNISWGKWVQIGDFTILSAYCNSKLEIGNNVTLGGLSRYIVTSSLKEPGQYIRIGNSVGIGDYAHIGGGGGVEIGDNCIIGSYFSCHPSNHNFDNIDLLIKDQGLTKKGIKVGSNCWIGAKVTILDGVEVGKNCVLAAGSVLTKSFPDDVVIGGIPAKIIRHIKESD